MPRCYKCDEFLSEDDLYCPECGERQRRTLSDDRDGDRRGGSRREPSGMATASFVLAVIGALIWAGIFGAAYYFAQAGPPGQGVEFAIGCSAFIAVALHAVGLGLGIAGSIKQDATNKWMAVVGLVISILGVIGFAIVLILGVAMMDKNAIRAGASTGPASKVSLNHDERLTTPDRTATHA